MANQRYVISTAFTIFILLNLININSAATKSVLTFKYFYGNTGQLVTSSTLIWDSFNGDIKQLEYAVRGGKYQSGDESYPIYVCRAMLDGIFTSGHTKPHQQTTVCVIAMHTDVKMHHAFDILINKGHGGKLTWKPWNKFSGGPPVGAVSTSASLEDNFVARHKSINKHEKEDYIIGRYDSTAELGKIFIDEENKEYEYDEGEILVETEPVRYELRQIKMNKWKLQVSKNVTELGKSILSNVDSISNLVETVITYEYDKVQYWGTFEGVARGLPTKIMEIPRVSSDVTWGIKEVTKVFQTKPVSTNLQSGTAVNVTIIGTYQKSEAPYTAILSAYYADNAESVSREIHAYVQKQDLVDVKVIFGDVYWIHNQTLVPTTTTTTTTTTSTTSTTTEPSTTSTKEPKPALPPPIDTNEINEIAAADESRESSSLEQQMHSNEEKIEKDKKHNSNNGNGKSGTTSTINTSVINQTIAATTVFYFILHFITASIGNF